MFHKKFLFNFKIENKDIKISWAMEKSLKSPFVNRESFLSRGSIEITSLLLYNIHVKTLFNLKEKLKCIKISKFNFKVIKKFR